jgi:protease I
MGNSQHRPTALILVAEGFHEIETFVPYYRFLEIGWDAVLCSPQHHIEAIKGKYGMLLSTFQSLENIPWRNADILIIPGGRAPRYMVTHHLAEVQPVVDAFLEDGKPIAAMCHGPLLLAHASHPSVANLTMTAYKGIEPEVAPKVREFKDVPCEVSGNVVTSRNPDDIPDFLKGIFHVLFYRDQKAKQPEVHV